MGLWFSSRNINVVLEDCKPQDYDLWLECRNCGRLYQKYETKVEPEIEPSLQTTYERTKRKGLEGGEET